MIMKLLEIRTFLLKGYQKTRFIINPLLKFLLAFLVFKGINNTFGYDPRFTSTTVVLLLSVICAVTPLGMLVFLAMVLSLLQVFKASLLVAGLLFVVYVVLYASLMRFSPKQAIVSVLIPLLAGKNLHYCIPLILGCVATPLAALPCACGLVIYYMLSIIKAAAARQVRFNNMEDILGLFTDIVDATKANKQMFVAIAVFTIVIIVVFIIRKFSFEYALLVAIGAGIVANILGFLIADLKFSSTVKVGTLIIMSIVGGLIAFIVEFFKRVLDYTSIERVQFEDDDYYYYVKAVPKVNVAMSRHSVRKIGEETNEEYDEEDDDNYSDIHIVGNDDVRYEEYTEDDYNVDTDTSDDTPDDDVRPYYPAHHMSSGPADDLDEDPDGSYVPDADDADGDDEAEVRYVDYEDDDFN